MQTLSLIALATLAVGLIPLFRSLVKLRGTTMIGPWCWAIASVVFLIAMLCSQNPSDQDSASHLDSHMVERYLISITTFLPAMAVLGAKRPQHWGWQFIVATLWVVLAWPALEALVQGIPFALQTQKLRGGFLIILLAVQWSNWITTRYGVAITLLTVSQAGLLWPHFPWSDGQAKLLLWGWSCIGVGVSSFVAWWCATRKTRPDRPSQIGVHYDRMWRDFRDMFGVVWSLRVMDRVNETARLQYWGWELTWSGFVKGGIDDRDATAQHDSNLQEKIEQSFQTLLRRFVSPEWIATRNDQAPMTNL